MMSSMYSMLCEEDSDIHIIQTIGFNQMIHHYGVDQDEKQREELHLKSFKGIVRAVWALFCPGETGKVYVDITEGLLTFA